MEIQKFVKENPKQAKKYAKVILNQKFEFNDPKNLETFKLKVWFLISENKLPSFNSLLCKEIEVSKISHSLKKEIESGDLLFIAISNNNTKEVGFLCHLVPFNVKNKFGNTPLHMAILEDRSIEVIKLLLAANPPLDAKNQDGNTPLHFAILRQPTAAKVINLLLEAHAPLDTKNEVGMTPLYWAILVNSSIEVLKLLLAPNPPMDAKNIEGDTPLHGAIKVNSSIEVIKLLLAANPPLDAKNEKGNTPLHSAILEGRSIKVIKLLLAANPPLDAKNEKGNTPLHSAILGSPPSIEVIKLLLAANPPLDAKNEKGNTPLHSAILGNPPSIEVINLLIKYGADPDLINLNGESPFIIANRRGLNIPLVSKKLSYNSEYSYRCLLAESWGINHEANINDKTINFSGGGWGAGGAKDALSLFEKFVSYQTQVSDLQKFKNLFKNSLQNSAV